MTYTVDFLPATYGDSIWIEYGEGAHLRRILIDGGTGGTKKYIKKKFAALPPEERVLELLVVTHIDRDHIEGILSLLEEDILPCTIKSIWFNGWAQLPENSPIQPFGAVQGERLTAAILKHNLPWNNHFGGRAVVVPYEGNLPVVVLEGGMEITLLSPLSEHLQKLRGAWVTELRRAGLDPGYSGAPPVVVRDNVESFGVRLTPDVKSLAAEKFEEDEAPANGSSIAFAATYRGRSVLFTGDAYPRVISQSLERLGNASFSLVKLAHHGSKANTSPELMEQLDCKRFVISTNGSNYHHPDEVTVARLITIKDNPQIIFNYRSEDNKIWKFSSLQQKYKYNTVYPSTEGISVLIR